ncbi:MAG: vitamin B12-dependent ribonucleotide reductase, partial [SAR324 cluster bacterium]|nr:vitamin B12-dependent ribonucleotide reductase [SAR324 cluster bacterium]
MEEFRNKTAGKPEDKKAAKGMAFARHFTRDGQDPYEAIAWSRRRAVISEPDGSIVFEMNDVEVPESWSQLATDIVVSKYFRKANVPEIGKETSVRQVVRRITSAIHDFGEKQGYFRTPLDGEVFEDELAHLLLTQKGAFNSPVWFNCGLFQAYGIVGSNGNWHYDVKQKKP